MCDFVFNGINGLVFRIEFYKRLGHADDFGVIRACTETATAIVPLESPTFCEQPMLLH
jgi:hypothetical protein